MFALKTFPCPNCHEFINSGMEKCKYCSITIDPQVANAAVELQDKVNRSCNEASLLRNIAGAMWVGFFVRFVPFIGIVGLIIMVIGFIVVPPWLIYWQIKFGRIKTADVDYKRANRNWFGALVLWLLLLIILVVLILFVAGF
jgi:hypothetical protein